MNIKCERDKFSHAFQLVATITAARDVKPVLQNVLIKIDDETVTLMATDSEIGIRMRVDGCEITEPGSAILPTRLVKSILQESNDPLLEINGNDEKMTIFGARSRFELPTQSVSDFPEIEPFEETSYTAISSKVFREMIKRTIFATDEESTRYSLGGVHLDFGSEELGCVATDGRRLAHQVGAVESVNEHQPEGSSIFPSKSLTLIERAASEEETVKIAVSENRGIFGMDKLVVYTRLIEGKFPRWRSIIPSTEGKKEIPLISGALLSAVRQAAIVTSEKQPGVDFIFENGKLELCASGAEVGESSVEIPIAFDGEKLSCRLDPKFVIDFLRVLEPEKNISVFLASDEPVYWKTDDGYEYVVMPISS